jgi:threonylcarbamoyladenosine tRNA methylthiotransferase MtaB
VGHSPHPKSFSRREKDFKRQIKQVTMKVYLRTHGCRLNQAEIDSMALQFQQQGHEVVNDPALADQIIVNTCAVTADATRSSRQTVRDLHRVNAGAAINVTGCYAQIAPAEVGTLPGVARVVDNLAKERLVQTITGQATEPFDLEPLERVAKGGAYGRTRAFVKVQDGCDNACTFCVTTIARGDGRSRPLEAVLTEIQGLLAAGYQEVVLTGVQLGSYGHDWGDRAGLIHLIQSILRETDTPRLRLSSLEPWDLTDSFFQLWAGEPRLCRHLHLPLQSGCDATLRRMRRRTSQAEFRQIVQMARAAAPVMKLTTDVIVGFPCETDAEFAITEAFVGEIDFAGLHVFRYSPRPGTAAARMKGHLPEVVKKARSARLLVLAAEGERRFCGRFAGGEFNVLWEHISGVTADGFINVGYTDHYVRVRCIHPRALTDHITPVRLGAYVEDYVEATPLLGDMIHD